VTFLTMEGSGTHARRHAARWSGLAVHRSNVPAVTPSPLLPQRARAVEHEAGATRRTWGEIGAAALLILALHVRACRAAPARRAAQTAADDG
jgi:protein TonB